MIGSVSFKNIKKHRDLTLLFSRGVNIIFGMTDSGKTGSLLGLRWVLFNDRDGDSMLSHGTKSCKSTITKDDHTIIRSYGSNENAYYLDGDDADHKFENFRTDVPKQVKEIINMSDVNLQKRRDPPFMIGEKASENASRFSQMLDLQEIGTSIANVNRYVKEAKQDIEVCKVEIENLQSEIKKLDDVESAMLELEAITTSEKESAQVDADVTNLRRLLDVYTKQKEAVTAAEGIITALEEIKALSVEATAISTAVIEANKAVLMLNRYESASTTLSELGDIEVLSSELFAIFVSAKENAKETENTLKAKSMLTKYEDAKTVLEGLEGIVEGEDKLNLLYGEAVKIQKESASIVTLTSLYQTQESMEKVVDTLGKSLKTAEAKLKAKMPKICPVCGKPKGDCND